MQILRIVVLAILFQLSSASAGIIILPEAASRKNCWVWLIPPVTVHKAAADFLSRVALGLLPKAGLAEPGRTTLELMAQLNSGRLRVEIKEAQTEPFKLSADRLSLSVDAADKIVRARSDDPAQLLETSATVDPGLATAWLEQLGTGKTNLWDETETRLRWHQSASGANAKSNPISPLELARKLWPRVTEARADGNTLPVAEAFGAERLAELAPDSQGHQDLHDLTKVGFTTDLIAAFVTQGDYRTAFLELGLRAANLATADQLHASGSLKALEGRQLIQKLQADYNEVFALLARQLQTGLIIMPRIH